MKRFFLFVFCLILTVTGCNREEPGFAGSSSNSSQPQTQAPFSSESPSSEPSSVPVDSSEATVSDTSPVILNDESGIPDPVLYQAILSELKKRPEEHFTVKEALGISFLNHGFLSTKIKDIRGIGYLKNLTFLHLAENEITDASPVTALKQLKSLNLASNKLTDTSVFSGMTQLDSLTLAYNQITDISPLANLTNLKELGLWYNEITDITPLLKLTKLSQLSLEANLIDMSDPVSLDAVGVLQGRIKYFALGLQGIKRRKPQAKVNLYIGSQQTLDSFSNIVYVSGTLNGKPVAFNTLYQLTEPGTYMLKLSDNLKTDYNFTFVIKAE